MKWIIPPLWNPKLLKHQNGLIQAAKSKVSSFFSRQKHTTPTLPKTYFLHPGNSSLWELEMLSLHKLQQGLVGAPQTISVSEHTRVSPLKQHFLCQMGLEPTLSSLVSLATAQPQTKQSKSTLSARSIYTLKCNACLSVSSYSCGVFGVHQEKITAGVSLWRSQQHQ